MPPRRRVTLPDPDLIARTALERSGTPDRPLLAVASACVAEGHAAISLWRQVRPLLERVLEAVSREEVPTGRDGRELLREAATTADRVSRCVASFSRATADLVRLQGYLEGGFRVVTPEGMTEAELEKEVVVVCKGLLVGKRRCPVCNQRVEEPVTTTVVEATSPAGSGLAP